MQLRIAYIGGGSRGWAWLLMRDLAMEPELDGVIRLYDIDRPRAEANAAIGNRFMSGRAGSRWSFEVVDTLEAALRGADFVVISITPEGGFDAMGHEIHLPESYGVYQSVGDTTGPGGFFRPMRSMETYRSFAGSIAVHSPDAWVINYTNPMTLLVATLYREVPSIKAFGCCHEVFGTQYLIAQIAERHGLGESIPREKIRANVLGINHFTWLDAASLGAIDLMPHFERFVAEHADTGFDYGIEGSWTNGQGKSGERVKMDLFQTHGLIAAAGDRHLVEFLGSPYLESPETADDWMFHLTPISFRREKADRLAAMGRRLLAGEDELELTPTGEEGVKQIRALCGLDELVTNANLPNRGQLAGIDDGDVVETNGLFRRDSVQPIVSGRLPGSIEAVVRTHLANRRSTLDGFFDRNNDALFEAFCADPLLESLSDA